MRKRLGLFLKQPSMDALVSMGGYSINYLALSQMEMTGLLIITSQKTLLQTHCNTDGLEFNNKPYLIVFYMFTVWHSCSQ
jgi:hypothetical protein